MKADAQQLSSAGVAGDPLERLAGVVDFEVFRGPLIAALHYVPTQRACDP